MPNGEFQHSHEQTCKGQIVPILRMALEKFELVGAAVFGSTYAEVRLAPYSVTECNIPQTFRSNRARAPTPSSRKTEAASTFPVTPPEHAP